MEKPIRVRLLGREYPLRVREEDEDRTREIAAYVDRKMQAFKEAHPEQSEIVTAVITALALAEELYETRDEEDRWLRRLDDELGALDRQLGGVLVPDEGFDGAGERPAHNGEDPEKRPG
jgi:cell division protein ZapA